MIDFLIIGGGAAGLYAASLISEAVILERNDICGKKLLLTGGGRCNYTHNGTVPEIMEHYHGNINFIRKVLYRHTPDDIITHFRELGIKPGNENGKIFPLYGDAHSIRDALLHNGNRIIRGKALSIEKNDAFFVIRTENEIIKARKILFAPGGMAYPRTGSDGSGYQLIKTLGHSIEPPYPALAPLELTPSLKDAEGITIPITIRKDKKEISDTAVITKRGISGPAAENFSYLLSGRENVTISFDDCDIKSLRETSGAALLKNALSIPPRLSQILLGPLAEKKIANLSKAEAAKAEEIITRYTFSCRPIAEGAMSTRGGVKTSEIKAETMESKLIPGLYFAGDIIDIDADCGGYSLTWAFATAYIASLSCK